MTQQVKNSLAMQETQEMQVRSLVGEHPMEEENDNPLRNSCLENPTDREAWRAIVQSRTQLRDSATLGSVSKCQVMSGCTNAKENLVYMFSCIPATAQR